MILFKKNRIVTYCIITNRKNSNMEDLNKNQETAARKNNNTENLSEEKIEKQEENTESANLAEDLEHKFADLNDSYLRLHAEFDNYRKRTLKEKTDLVKTGNEKTILGVLPIVDDFERAMPLIPEDAREGVELIYTKFKNFLKQNGVEIIPTIGQPFDSELHEAITTIPAQSEEQRNKIVDCIEQGYTLNGKVIRFAKVIVAK